MPHGQKNHTQSTAYVPGRRLGWGQRALQSNAGAPRKKTFIIFMNYGPLGTHKKIWFTASIDTLIGSEPRRYKHG